MVFKINIIQSWQESKKFLPWENRLDDLEDVLPVRFYISAGENVAPIIKSGDTLDIILSSSSDPEKKTVQDLFDSRCISSFPDGLYLVDYVLSKVLIDAQKSKVLDERAFTIFPPNAGNNKLNTGNFIFIDKQLGWHRCYAKENGFPHLLYILDEINFMTWDKKNFTPTSFGINLVVDALVDIDILKAQTQYEKTELLKAMQPRGLEKPFQFVELLNRFGTLEENKWEDFEEDGYLSRNIRRLFENQNKGPKEIILADGSILESSKVFFTLTQLLRFHTVPTVQENMYVELDITTPGISEILLMRNRMIKVKYDSSKRNEEEIYDIFANFKPDVLILEDTSTLYN